MGKKILLADDSITIQKVIELTFSDEDFEVVTVGNGRLAIERVLDVRPDVVLCDIIMPEKDGYEVCDFIKKTPQLAHVPVLLLTGAFEPFDQERAARVGCDGFLAKPFEPQTLIARVKELLSQPGTRPPASPARPAAVAAAPEPGEPFPLAAETGIPEPAPLLDGDEPANGGEPAADEVSFIPEEPFLEYGEAPAYDEPAEAAPEPPAALASQAMDPDLYGVVDAVDAAPDELISVTPEESATLGAGPDPAATLMFKGGPPAPWQTTMEVPLETRARAGVESIQRESDAGIFEEVFEDDTLNLKGSAAPDEPAEEPEPADEPLPFDEPSWEPMAELDSSLGTDTGTAVPDGGGEEIYEADATAPAMSALVDSAEETLAPSLDAEPPTPAPPPAPAAGIPAAPAEPDHAPPPAAVEPAVAASPAEASAPAVPAARAASEPTFADLRPEEPEAAAPVSAAAEASVPVDMVAQIAQRVVAQISEKVVREIAWEVVPDLAEALIKREIERLKAELQHT